MSATAKAQLDIEIISTGREVLTQTVQNLRSLNDTTRLSAVTAGQAANMTVQQKAAYLALGRQLNENRRIQSAYVQQWRQQNQTIVIGAQVVSRFAGLAQSLISIYTALSVGALNTRDSQRRLADANDEVAEKTQRVNEIQTELDDLLLIYPDSAQPVIDKQGELQTANDDLADAVKGVRDAQSDLNDVLSGQPLLWTGILLSVAAQVGTFVLMGAQLNLLRASLGLSSLSLSGLGTALAGVSLVSVGLVGAIVAVAAGMAAGFLNILAHKDATNSWRDAIELAIADTKTWPPVLRELGEFFTKSAGGWILLGEQIAIGASNMSRDISNWAASAGATITGFVGSAQTAFGNFVTFITGIAESIWQPLSDAAVATWDAIGKAVKSGVNFIIDNINKLITGWNFIIAAVNRVSGLIGITLPSIPTIPRLARGGTIEQAGFATVGEQGPEQLFLPRGASVVPLTGGGGGGFGDLHVHVHVNGIISDNVAHEIGKIAAEQIFRQVRRLGSKVVQ